MYEFGGQGLLYTFMKDVEGNLCDTPNLSVRYGMCND